MQRPVAKLGTEGTWEENPAANALGPLSFTELTA
jgi:hypothetical protein